MMSNFIKVRDDLESIILVPVDEIQRVKITNPEKEFEVFVFIKGGRQAYNVKGIEAIRIIMLLAPHAIEGKRLKFKKHSWSVHNLIGHPLMQLFSFLRMYKLAFKIHDMTIPTPKGLKK